MSETTDPCHGQASVAIRIDWRTLVKGASVAAAGIYHGLLGMLPLEEGAFEQEGGQRHAFGKLYWP